MYGFELSDELCRVQDERFDFDVIERDCVLPNVHCLGVGPGQESSQSRQQPDDTRSGPLHSTIAWLESDAFNLQASFVFENVTGLIKGELAKDRFRAILV